DHGPQRPPPRIFTRLQTTEQTLAPGLLTTQFWFDLEVRNASIRTLVCECDPTLQPEEVRLPNLESWKLLPGPTPAHPSTLLVHARDWFKGGTLQVRCLAPLASQGRWTCPQIRLLHG